MGNMSSYSIAILCSVALHVGLGVFIVNKWEPEQERTFVKPKYVVAELVEMKPKAEPKPKPKPKNNDVAQKKKQEELRRKKAQEDKRRKEKAKKEAERKKRLQAEREKKRKQDLEKKRKAQEQEKKRQEELARKNKMKEDMLAALEDEKERQVAEGDEEIASAYSGVIKKRVSGNWSRPPSARLGMEAEVIIKLNQAGQVINVTVVKGSGDPAFDESVKQAVLKADSFPELQKLEYRVFDKYFRNLRLVFRPEDLRK